MQNASFQNIHLCLFVEDALYQTILCCTSWSFLLTFRLLRCLHSSRWSQHRFTIDSTALATMQSASPNSPSAAWTVAWRQQMHPYLCSHSVCVAWVFFAGGLGQAISHVFPAGPLSEVSGRSAQALLDTLPWIPLLVMLVEGGA